MFARAICVHHTIFVGKICVHYTILVRKICAYPHLRTTAQASKLHPSNLILPSLPMESGGEDEVQMIGTGGQLVPVASDGSPSKRPPAS